MKQTTLVMLLTAVLGSAAAAQEADVSTPADAAAPTQSTPAATTDAAPAVNTSEPRARRAPTDRIDLETTIVTGNRELPKVLYIVPWKKAELGELPAQPFNTLLDEVLTPLDRDVFRREVTYYGAISGGTQPQPAGENASSQSSPTQ